MDEPGAVSLHSLRKAVQANRVAFPIPIPIFAKQQRADIQWRVVDLYFVRGWSSKQLATRYDVSDRRIQQLLQHWVIRAKSVGFLQAIATEATENVTLPVVEISCEAPLRNTPGAAVVAAV